MIALLTPSSRSVASTVTMLVPVRGGLSQLQGGWVRTVNSFAEVLVKIESNGESTLKSEYSK